MGINSLNSIGNVFLSSYYVQCSARRLWEDIQTQPQPWRSWQLLRQDRIEVRKSNMAQHSMQLSTSYWPSHGGAGHQAWLRGQVQLERS